MEQLVNAIANGLRSQTLQAKLSSLEAERNRLAGAFADTKPTTVRPMPQIGTTYRARQSQLHESLTEGQQPEAVDAARALIHRVITNPGPPGQPPGIFIEG